MVVAGVHDEVDDDRTVGGLGGLKHGIHSQVAGVGALGEVGQHRINGNVIDRHRGLSSAAQHPADLLVALVTHHLGRVDHGVHVFPGPGLLLTAGGIHPVVVAGVHDEVDDDLLLSHRSVHLPIQLILLQGQGQLFFLAFIANVGSLLIPAVEGIALGDRGSIESVGLQILSADVIRVAVVCDLVAVGVQDVVVHRVLVPDHGDDVGPAIDGDLSQALDVLISLVLVPGAVVEPAVEQEAVGKLVCSVVVVDAQVIQVQNLALLHGVKRDRLEGGLCVAVAVDDDLNLLQVIDHGAQIGVSIDGPFADGIRPITDLMAPDAVPLISGGAAGVQAV